MVYYGEDPAVIKNAQIIWEQVRSLEEKPIYPAICAVGVDHCP